MRGRIVAALAMMLVLMGALASTADAQRWRERERERGWLLLGEKEVGFGVDRDVIRIGQARIGTAIGGSARCTSLPRATTCT